MKLIKISRAIFCKSLILALGCFLCCNSHARPIPKPPLMASTNGDFSFNLLKALVAEQPGSNIFISPYSASTALQMVSAGAVGTTRSEMQEMLGTASIAPIALYEDNRVLEGIINAKNTNYALNTANAVWYQTGFPIEKGFLAVNHTYFGAAAQGVDFNQPTTADTINAWASDETQGKINQIVSYPFDPGMVMLLANAVYFHGTWQYQFNTNFTTNRPFYLAGGGQDSVPMMEQSTNFNYSSTDAYQAVRLPYQGSNLAMYVFLPAANSNLNDLLGAMSEQWWQQAAKLFLPQQGTIILPKFNLEYDVTLNGALMSLGMNAAFTDEANFSKISTDPLHISKVKQKAIVEVNEEGTVAAAVTTIGIVTSVVGPFDPFQMTVNRPFIFLIVDEPAQTILFLGAVADP